MLFDGRYAHYHLYYANAERGSRLGDDHVPVQARARPPRLGPDPVDRRTRWPRTPLTFWLDHLKRHEIENSGIQERFGEQVHPLRAIRPGCCSRSSRTLTDDRAGLDDSGEISNDVTMRGFFGIVLSVREIPEHERFLTEALGFKKAGVDGAVPPCSK